MQTGYRVSRRQQQGAFLVIMSLLMVILLGVAALALDFSRVVALRAEMQNAVDAAALAGAVELNGKANAQLRARSAARNALTHSSQHARVAELLGDVSLPDTAFEYFCIIGSKHDVSDDIAPAYCPGTSTQPNLWPATGDSDTHYVRINLDPALVADHFRVDLIFLPVLNVLGINPATFVALSASATAGRSFYSCNYPPLVLCDPFENIGARFKDVMSPGQAIILREQGGGSAWSSGNFGFLQPANGGSGAANLVPYLADANLTGCTSTHINTKPGQNAGPTTSAINTRFDIYTPPLPATYAGVANHVAWPPAPNIVEYGNDATFQDPPHNRFGTGNWDFDTYWAAKHPGVIKPNGWSNLNRPGRSNVYAYEIANGLIPLAPSHTPGAPERRVLRVAIASCDALGLHGNASAVLMAPDGFAKIFIFSKAGSPGNSGGGNSGGGNSGGGNSGGSSGGGTNGLAIHGEYMGWSEEDDEDYHVTIQLYQ